MIESAVWKKLGVKPGGRLRVLRLPAGVELALAPLPEGAQRVARGRGDVVLAFFEDRAAVARHFEAARAALAEGGALWLAYPKKRAQKKTAEKPRGQAAGGIASDLGRDGYGDVTTFPPARPAGTTRPERPAPRRGASGLAGSVEHQENPAFSGRRGAVRAPGGAPWHAG